jgi:uncharacterized membrane protein YdfJ with MMPL/SSD domain
VRLLLLTKGTLKRCAGPIQSFMPIFLVGIAFVLTMDYEIFLVSQVQEAYDHG